MANQTTMNPDLATMEPSPGSMVGNIAEFGNDIATLVELQAKLAVFDTKEVVARAVIPVVCLAGGAVLAVSSVPILLLGLADLLHAVTTLTFWGSLLIVAVAALALAGLVAFLSYKAAVGSITSFRRSAEEFTRNLSWVRTVLVHSGRAASRSRI